MPRKNRKSRTTKQNRVNPFGAVSRFKMRVLTSLNGRNEWVIVDRDQRCPVTGGYKIVSRCNGKLDALETLASMGG